MLLTTIIIVAVSRLQFQGQIELFRLLDELMVNNRLHLIGQRRLVRVTESLSKRRLTLELMVLIETRGRLTVELMMVEGDSCWWQLIVGDWLQ